MNSYFSDNLWLTQQTNTPKTWRANTTWTTSALIATCAAKPRRTISNATTTADIPSFTSNRLRPKKKRVAKKPKKAVPSKPSATTAHSPKTIYEARGNLFRGFFISVNFGWTSG